MKRMKWKKITACGLILVMLVQTTACNVQGKLIREKMKKGVTILGFGDSITEGGPDFFSYLFPLDSMLNAAGYQVKFIGPRRSTLNGDTLFHSGFSGKTAEFLAAHTDSIYSLYPADIILLHSGHNHFQEENPVSGIITAQRTILQTIRNKNRDAIIFVAAVITSGKLPKYEYIPQLNRSIREMVDSFHDPLIVFVDQSKDWNWTKYTITDKVHPNRDGARVIAGKWFKALTNSPIKK